MKDRPKLFLLRFPEFFKLWLGQITSQAGTRIYQIALIWWIMTASPEQSGQYLALFMVAGALPGLLFYRVMGRIVDSCDTRKVLVICDLCSCAIMAMVAWLLLNDQLTLPVVYLCSFLVATAEGVFNPALAKGLPSIVAPEAIEKAVAWQSSTQHLASFGGAVLGALLINRLGIPLLVVVNAISYFFSATIELMIDFSVWAPENQKPEAVAANARPEKIDFSRFPMLKKLLLGFGMINFFSTPTLLTLPLYVKHYLKMDADVLGWLQAALWIGILIGTFSASLIKSKNRTILIGACCMLALGLGLLLPGFFASSLIAAKAMAIAGLALGINNVKFVTLFQRVVPANIKGQFFAAMQAIVSLTFPVAYLVFGFLGDQMPANQVFIIQGSGVMIVSLWFFIIRNQESALESSDGVPGV